MGHEPPSRYSYASEEDRFRRLFEQSMDAVYIGTPDGAILDVNQAWLDLFGYSREELPSLNAIDFYVNPEERADFLRRMDETEFVRDEVLYRRKDGSIFLCQRSLVACRDETGTIVAFQGINRDISNQRAAENALRISEQRYRSLFEQSMDAIYITTPDGSSIEANQAWLDLFGYEREDLSTLNAVDLYADPSDREAFVRRIKETGFIKDEVRFKRKDGSVIDCERTVVALRDEAGKLTAYQGVHRDITARRLAEKALRESEQKFRALFTDAPISILIHDIETGEIIDANHAACAAYEVASVEDLRDVDLWLDPPYSFDDALSWIRKAATDGPQQFEWLNRTVKGQLFWEQVRLTPVTINNVPRIMAVSVDLTERKKAEDVLRASEERYRTLFQNVMDAVCLISPGGLLLEANLAYLDLFGYTEADVGRVNVEHQYTDPNEHTRMLEWLATHDVLLDDEVQLRNRDGTVMDCIRNAVARRDSAGTFIGAQSVIRDVTRQKRILQELRESQERFMQLAEQSRTFAWEVDENARYTYVSDTVKIVLGFRPEEIVEVKHFYDLHPDEGREQLKEYGLKLMRSGEKLADFENPLVTRDGRIVWVSSNGVPLLSKDGTVIGYRGWDMDITERKQAEAAITASEQRFRSLFEQSRDAIYIGTPDGTVIDVNQAWLDLFGYTREDLPSISATDFYAHPEERLKFLKRIIRTGVVEDEVRFRRKDGSEFDCARNVVARQDQHGNIVAVQGLLRDITQQKRDRAALEYLARYDTLTDLLNRHSIVEKLSEWMRHSRRYHARLSIVLLDIDHFKRINDTYGHAAGDRVLEETASLLMSSTRQADFVGRYGGEEFLIILPRTDIKGAAVIAERIRKTMENSLLHVDDEATVPVTISLGVARWHEDDSDDSLLARVDAALYRAKENGRNRVEVILDTSAGA